MNSVFIFRIIIPDWIFDNLCSLLFCISQRFKKDSKKASKAFTELRFALISLNFFWAVYNTFLIWSISDISVKSFTLLKGPTCPPPQKRHRLHSVPCYTKVNMDATEIILHICKVYVAQKPAKMRRKSSSRIGFLQVLLL